MMIVVHWFYLWFWCRCCDSISVDICLAEDVVEISGVNIYILPSFVFLLALIFGCGCICFDPLPTRAISKLSKITSVIYPKNDLSQTCDYWLITPNQQRFCIENNMFQQWAITNQRAGNYKAAGTYKITPLTVQCWSQSIVWL